MLIFSIVLFCLSFILKFSSRNDTTELFLLEHYIANVEFTFNNTRGVLNAGRTSMVNVDSEQTDIHMPAY